MMVVNMMFRSIKYCNFIALMNVDDNVTVEDIDDDTEDVHH